jgi:hypothetical protein
MNIGLVIFDAIQARDRLESWDRARHRIRRAASPGGSIQLPCSGENAEHRQGLGIGLKRKQ